MLGVKRGLPRGGVSTLPDPRGSWNRGLWLRRNVGDAIGVEQRRTKRYPLSLDLTYTVSFGRKILDYGGGRTIDWSSSGLRFVGERPIEVGRRLEIAIQWPLTLEDGVPLKVVVFGKSVRTAQCETSLQIDKYEFRTYRFSDERRLMDATRSPIKLVYAANERPVSVIDDLARSAPPESVRPARPIHYRG